MSVPSRALIDSDILSLYFKKHPIVVSAARDYLLHNSGLTISIITRFEILRGMKVRNSPAQLAAFDSFCRSNEIVGLSDEVIVRGSDIYSYLHKSGKLIGDADILIAATALVNDLVVVTNNENHFRRIPGLQVINWAV